MRQLNRESRGHCLCRAWLRTSSLVIYLIGLLGCLYCLAESVEVFSLLMTEGLVIALGLASVGLFAAGMIGALVKTPERIILVSITVLVYSSLLSYILISLSLTLEAGFSIKPNLIESFLLGPRLGKPEDFCEAFSVQLSLVVCCLFAAQFFLIAQMAPALALLCQRKQIYSIRI